MRLFVAIELPEEVKHQLAGLRRDMAGVRWVAPEQLHLTMLFLGDLTEETTQQLSAAFSSIRIEPFELEIDRTGCFPDTRAPRVLWVGVMPRPELAILAERLRAATQSCGIVLEKRSFTPHITLARVKQPGAGAASCFLNQIIGNKFPVIHVRQFVLFHSCLTQQGAIHKPISRFYAGSAAIQSDRT